MKHIKNKLGLVSAIVLMALGMWLFAISFGKDSTIVLLTYGSISIGLGVYMLFHLDKEDAIEQIKHGGK